MYGGMAIIYIRFWNMYRKTSLSIHVFETCIDENN